MIILLEAYIFLEITKISKYYIILANKQVRKWKFDRIMLTLRDNLHWLPVDKRIEFKLRLLVLLHKMALPYLASMCVQLSARRAGSLPLQLKSASLRLQQFCDTLRTSFLPEPLEDMAV